MEDIKLREEEKIFAGKLFDARTQALKDIKHKAHILCQKYNSMEEYDKNRLPIIKEFIGNIGEKYYFQGPIQFNYGTHTFIGENFFLILILQLWMMREFISEITSCLVRVSL